MAEKAAAGRAKNTSKAGAAVEPADEPRDVPFWRRKKLEAMTSDEWESLCDGCGRCCLVKLEDADTGRIHFTNVACKLLETGSCRCGDYSNRKKHVPDCIKLTPGDVHKLPWLPPSCAYRLVGEGKDLMWWHPLVSGSTETVHSAGISVRNKVRASEDDVDWDDLPEYIVRWPGQIPKRALGPGPTGKINAKTDPVPVSDKTAQPKPKRD